MNPAYETLEIRKQGFKLQYIKLENAFYLYLREKEYK